MSCVILSRLVEADPPAPALPDGYRVYDCSALSSPRREMLTSLVTCCQYAHLPPAEAERAAITCLDWFFSGQSGKTNPELWMLLDHAGQPVGVALGSLQEGHCQGYVSCIGLLPAYQNQGLGTILLVELLQRFARVGVRRVNLLLDENEARNIHFYHKLGWLGPYDDPTCACIKHAAEVNHAYPT